MQVVVYDANVLYPSTLRDVLIRVGLARLVQPKWTERILDEMFRNLLRHIGIGRTHKGTHVILLIQDLNVTVIAAATGEILRELTIDTTRDYQPTRAEK